MKIHKGDTVEVLVGEDKGRRGVVQRVVKGWITPRRKGKMAGKRLRDKNSDRVVVAGVNLVKKHQRPTGQMQSQAGIVEMELPIHISNVGVVCKSCEGPTRIGYEVMPDGTKLRVCKRCGDTLA